MIIFRCDVDGNPTYSVPRLIEIWPLLQECQDLVGEERALYDAASTTLHELDCAMLEDDKLAERLGWAVERVRLVAEAFDEHWIQPNPCRAAPGTAPRSRSAKSSAACVVPRLATTGGAHPDAQVLRVRHHGERFPWVARPYSPEKKAPRGLWSRLPSREPRRGSVVGAPPITGRSFFSKYGASSGRVPHHGEC